MDHSAPPGPPIFIVGCGRSGTTMLRLMFDSHPDVAIPGESHFIPKLWKECARFQREGRLDVAGLVDAILSVGSVRRWEVPRDMIEERVRAVSEPTYAAVVEAVFLAYADLHGKSRWGDKTPKYVVDIPLLSKLYPSGLFIHIIRDGRDVALSYLDRREYPYTIWQAAHRWSQMTGAGIEHGRGLGPSRYLELRYEDLVADPTAELKRACEFAELSFDKAMLEYHLDAESRIEARPDKLRFHGGVASPPTAGLRDWRTQMSPRDVLAFESVAGTLLSSLVYERAYDPLPAGARLRGMLHAAGVETRLAGSRAKTAVLRRSSR